MPEPAKDAAPAFKPWNLALARTIIDAAEPAQHALLPLLHELQATFGYIDREAEPLVAAALNISRADVHGVVTFYHDFRQAPPARHTLRICRAEACQARGSDALTAEITAGLGAPIDTTTADGAVSFETVYCLGLCASGPAVMLDGKLFGRVEPGAGARRLIEGLPAMSVRVFVPADAAAIAVGADEVAAAIRAEAAAAGIPVEIVRTGSRGLFSLEPLVEVATAGGRIGYGPVSVGEVKGLIATGMLDGTADEKRVGRPETLPFFQRQTRLTFARCGITDPLSLEDYRAHGGMKGLEHALSLGAAATIDEVEKSGLRGRGGAGFPTGRKWRTVAAEPAQPKYVVCNADEGDSGTFADRMLMEGDPFALIEGMAIAGLAVGAGRGIVYIRSEYPHAIATMRRAVEIARADGLLGKAFDIDIFTGAGSYVCGEETALLESLEGKRGQVRARPPLPAMKGLFGRPTVVNNIISLATVPWILAEGAAAYAAFGMGRSRGTMPIQLAGYVKNGGLFEAAFGLTLGELVDDIGGGTASGRPVRAVQVGGPLGAYFPRGLFDTPFDYEAFTARDGLIGHGGIVVFDDTVDMARQARFAFEFCAAESCGKCTPCRIGSTRGVEIVDRMLAGTDRTANAAILEDLCHTLKFGSLCALGGFTPYPVMSALRHFPADFGLVPAPAGG